MAKVPDGFEEVSPGIPDGFEAIAAPTPDSGWDALWNTSKVAGAGVAEGAALALNMPRDVVGVAAEKAGNLYDAFKADVSGGLDRARYEYRMAQEDATRKYTLNLFDSADNLRAKAKARALALEAQYGKEALTAPSSGDDARKWVDKNFDVRNTMRMVGVEPGTAEQTTKALGIENTGVRRYIGDISRAAGTTATIPIGGLVGRIVTGAASGAAERADKNVGVSEAVGLPPGLIGGVGGGFLPGAAGALLRQGGNLVSPLVNRQGIADRALYESMGNKPLAAMPPNPLPGAPLTLGERTGNVGANRLQLALRADPKIQAAGLDFEAAARNTGAKAVDEMTALASGSTERQASEALRKQLTSAYRSEKAMVTPDIDAVKSSLPRMTTPGTRLDNHIGHYVDLRTAERRSWLRDAGLGRLETVAQSGRVRLNEIDDILASMKAKAREMPAGDPRRVEVERFIAHMQRGMERIVPNMRPAYRQYAQFKGDFDNNALIGKLFARNKDRTFKITPSEIGDALQRMPAEAIERVARISPGVKTAGKDWLSASWREASTKIAGDTASYAAARNFFRDNEAFFKAFYTPAEFKRAKEIMAALEMREAPRTVTGITRFNSPTMEKIQNATFLDGLAGKAVNRIPGAQKAMEFLYSKSTEEIKAKLAQALLNPDTTFARLLTMKPTPGMAALLKSYWTKAVGRAAAYQGAQPDQ